MNIKDNSYDIIFIGAGISSLLSAYHINKQNPELSILIIDGGKSLDKRSCPLLSKKVNKCIKCKSCSIMCGECGAGAFSDGKFNLTSQYGGWLTDYLTEDQTNCLINEVEDVLTKFGAENYPVYYPDNYLLKKCLQNGMKMQQGKVKHFGTDGNLNVMAEFTSYLHDRVNFIFNSKVLDIDKNSNKITISSGESYTYRNLVVAVGRSGASWFASWCDRNDIQMKTNQVDIGVRVELPRIIWQDISEKVYEPKILYKTKKYGDQVRMFCFNSGGEVVIENTDGIFTVNGHANSSENSKTKMSNFAILSTVNFTEPFNKPIEYAKHIAKLGNMISGGGVLVQRLGDLVNGKRTDYNRLSKGWYTPTLKSAVPGDLSLCIPKRQLDNIIEMLYALDSIAPGTSNEDTLLYGVEAKYYSSRPNFIPGTFKVYDNIYAAGDGSGVTRSLAQAAAHGLFVAKEILQEV